MEALLTTLVEGLEVCWLHLLYYFQRVLGQILPNNPFMDPLFCIVSIWNQKLTFMALEMQKKTCFFQTMFFMQKEKCFLSKKTVF